MKKCVIIYKKNSVKIKEYTIRTIEYAGFLKRLLLRLNYKIKVGDIE